MEKWLVVVLLVGLTGCINVSMQLQPEDRSVKGTTVWSECVPILLGLGIGTLDVQSAYLAKIKTLEIQEYYFFLFGARCLEATGELIVRKPIN